MSTGSSILAFANALAPPPSMTIAEWCEKYVRLSPRQPTPFPGPYRISRTPWVQGWFDALNDPSIHTIVIRKGAQVAATQFAYAAMAYWICEDPGPVLVVMPASDDARSASETRVIPLIQDSPRVYEEVTDDKDDFKKMEYVLRKCVVRWIGANSPGKLASRPIRYLIMDEVDKYPANVGCEGSAIALAQQRCKRFWNRKILIISTPTTEDGYISRAYATGDQRKFFLQCRKCGEWSGISWQNVKFDSKLSPAEAAEGARYECPTCQHLHTDNDKREMVQAAQWRATATPRMKGVASFDCPGLIPNFSNTMAEFVEKFLTVKHIPSDLQDFVNSDLGEPFVHFDTAIKDSVFTDLEGAYDDGQLWSSIPAYAIPAEIERMVIGGVDVQKGYLVAVFREFIAGGDSGQIWRGTMASLEELHTLSLKYGAAYTGIDMRYRTREVQEWCASNAGYIACVGVSMSASHVFTLAQENIDEGTRNARTGQTIPVIRFSPDRVKEVLACNIQKRGGFRRWFVPRGTSLDSTYCKQMTAEREMAGRWINPQGKPNHFWDAETITIAVAMAVGMYRGDYATGEIGKDENETQT